MLEARGLGGSTGAAQSLALKRRVLSLSQDWSHPQPQGREVQAYHAPRRGERIGKFSPNSPVSARDAISLLLWLVHHLVHRFPLRVSICRRPSLPFPSYSSNIPFPNLSSQGPALYKLN